MSTQILTRPILAIDGQALAGLIRAIFTTMDLPKKGTAYEDPSLDHLYSYYQQPKCAYFVATKGNQLIGGAGIAPLAAEKSSICEFQKMYLHPDYRGQGIGQLLINKALKQAQVLGYKGCYLETLPLMKAAQALYKKNGFNYITTPMGTTGHTACHTFMYKNLDHVT